MSISPRSVGIAVERHLRGSQWNFPLQHGTHETIILSVTSPGMSNLLLILVGKCIPGKSQKATITRARNKCVSGVTAWDWHVDLGELKLWLNYQELNSLDALKKYNEEFVRIKCNCNL